MTLNEMRMAIEAVTGDPLSPFTGTSPSPRLTESWFCCAEPTVGQTVSIQLG
jgi:hypothetical protein